MDPELAKWLCFAFAVFAGVWRRNVLGRSVSEEQRIAEAKIHARWLIPILALFGGVVFLMAKTTVNPQAATIGFFVLLAVCEVIRTSRQNVRLRELRVPPGNRTSILAASALQILGLGGFFVL